MNVRGLTEDESCLVSEQIKLHTGWIGAQSNYLRHRGGHSCDDSGHCEHCGHTWRETNRPVVTCSHGARIGCGWSGYLERRVRGRPACRSRRTPRTGRPSALWESTSAAWRRRCVSAGWSWWRDDCTSLRQTQMPIGNLIKTGNKLLTQKHLSFSGMLPQVLHSCCR